MGSDRRLRQGARHRALPVRSWQGARFGLVLATLVVVQVCGGCEWWEWSSETVVVADGERPAEAGDGRSPRRVVSSAADPALDTTLPPTPAPPTTTNEPARSEPTAPPGITPLAGTTEPAVVEPTAPELSSPPVLPEEPAARPTTEREIASQALALIRYDWRRGLPGWEIRFLEGRRGYRGLTYPEQRLIEIFIRPSDTPASVAHVTAHEIAHAIDVERFGEAERSAWSAARGLRPGTPWFVHSGLSDFASGAGDFAESFAWWQTTASHWSGHLGPPPSPTQIGLLALLTGAS